MTVEIVIEIRKLCVSIHNQIVLEDVSLIVRKGDFFAIIGPNGAGKTTLIRAILGLLHPDSGEILLFNRPAGPCERARIGYVPQYHTFDFRFPITVRDMVLTGRTGQAHNLFPRHSKEDYFAVNQALERISATQYADRQIGELSGGERQRVLIARALAGTPDVLILDEPTVFVDTPTEDHFYELLASLSHEITILMITHDIGAVSHHVNKVACLNRRLYQHDSNHLTGDMISRTYGCPVDLITHGTIPHRVLEHHEDEHD